MTRQRNPYTGERVRIVRTPDVLGGEPRIDGVLNGRMPTQMVWEMVRDGRDHTYIFENYKLPKWETDAAVAYENRLTRRLGRRIEAAKRALCSRWDCGCVEVDEKPRTKGKLRHADIAEMFGVSRPAVTAIVARRTWKHVE